MAKFNYKQIRTSVAKNEKSQKRVQTVMNNKFESNKAILMEEFDNHDVTQDIEFGSNNISIDGGQGGNLRGFIGFPEGSNPIQPVRSVLKEKLVLVRKNVETSSSGLRFKFSIRIPKEELRDAAPTPFESGISWLAGVETGRIAGLANFLSGRFRNPPSRSSEGVQVKHVTRPGATFKKIPYLNDLIDKFVARFK